METVRETPRFKQYFESADIVVLGETTRHGEQFKTVGALIEQFRGTIAGLCIEISRDLQEDIDAYLAHGAIHEPLARLFRGAAAEGKPLVETMVLHELDLARKYHIPVYCYDAAKQDKVGNLHRAHQAGGFWFIAGACRDQDMFDYIVDLYTKRPGKYLVLIGGAHLSEHNREGDFKNFGRRMRDSFGTKYAAIRLAMGHEPLDDSFAPDAFNDTIVA